MKTDFGATMRDALRLTRARNVIEATRVIRLALAGSDWAGPPAGEPREPALLPPPPASQFGTAGAAQSQPRREPPERRPTGRSRAPLGEVLKLLRRAEVSGFRPGPVPSPGLRKPPPVPVPEGAAYLARSFTGAAGARDYKVYVPKRADRRAVPLVVMLHGCTQSSDDFAVGTGMNSLADELGFIVAYPQQPASANPSACWNWFDLAHQRRDQGEPAIIAGITRAVMAEFAVDPARVYVAGLSAGGAMAAILSAAYPELYAAAGIHSGLPHAAAADLPSAFAAMRGGPGPSGAKRPRVKGDGGRVRTIVFHGASDRTVDPSNADAILADARAGVAGPVHETREAGTVGGLAYARTLVSDAHGSPHAEYWAVDGLGHAWSGGSPDGSFTDRRGPDASREMLRFFLGGGS